MFKEDHKSKSPAALKTISEVATLLGVPQHVLRFWESKFNQIKPLKMKGARRYYRAEDVEVLQRIKHLLYEEGYTIKGARQAIGMKPGTAMEHDMSIEREEIPRLMVEEQPSLGLTLPQPAKSTAKKAELLNIKSELQDLKTMLAPHL